MFNALLMLFGASFALNISSLYGVGTEVISSKYATIMYSATSLFCGLGALSATYVACKYDSITNNMTSDIAFLVTLHGYNYNKVIV